MITEMHHSQAKGHPASKEYAEWSWLATRDHFVLVTARKVRT